VYLREIFNQNSARDLGINARVRSTSQRGTTLGFDLHLRVSQYNPIGAVPAVTHSAIIFRLAARTPKVFYCDISKQKII
jgi:hypothetical protein